MTDFSNYLLVTDLDGTFLGRGGVTVPRNLAALTRFRAGGGLFTIASGRLHLNIRVAIPNPEALCDLPLILGNGAYLYDFCKNEALCRKFLPPETAAALLSFVRERLPELLFRVSAEHELRVEKLVGYLKKDAANYDEGALKVIDRAENWRVDDWYKLVFRGDPEPLERARELIAAAFGDTLSITRSGLSTLEIQRTDCTKAEGVRTLRQMLAAQGKPRRVIACGDFDNDVEMLGEADIAVCPENAQPLAKEQADYVLCHCNGGLIADVVEKLERGEMR